MTLPLKNQIPIIFTVFFCWIGVTSCSSQTQLISTSGNPTSIAVTSEFVPTAQATLTDAPVPTAIITPIQASTPTEPTINKSIVVSDIPFNQGGGPGAMLALPGQVWTGTLFSGLQQWDPQTGELVMTIEGIEAKVFFDIDFEDNRLWVLASIDDPNQAEILYVIELPQGEVVKTIPISDEGDYGTAPTQLGSSPGKIWVNFGMVDTETLEYVSLPNGLPSEAHFVYDGEKWMWITGSWCDGCRHGLWLVNANDPTELKDSKNSGVLDTGVLGNPLVLADGKVWLVAHYYSENGAYYLDGYDILKTDQPEFHINVTNEIYDRGNVNMVADNRMVWVEAEGLLYYFDSRTGQKIGELKVGESVESIGFDGTSLWVLSSDAGLLQILLPWVP